MNTSLPLIIAHRGSSLQAPENTMAAVNLSWQENTDALEIDVHKTKDDEIVVIHDEDTKRTCGINKTINQSTLQEIQFLDAGSWKDKKYKNEIIPTFKEVVKTVSNNKKLVVEVKGGRECLLPVKNIRQY